MSKFPLLKTYRIIAIIFAVIVLISGIVTAGTAASIPVGFGSNFNLSVFLAALLPFLGGAFALGVVAELILLALRIEDHLDLMSRGFTRSSDASSLQSDNTKNASQMEGIVKVEKTEVRNVPGARRGSRGTLKKGNRVSVYGRNIDNRWVEIDGNAQYWILVDDLDIQGDIQNLPVTSDRR